MENRTSEPGKFGQDHGERAPIFVIAIEGITVTECSVQGSTEVAALARAWNDLSPIQQYSVETIAVVAVFEADERPDGMRPYHPSQIAALLQSWDSGKPLAIPNDCPQHLIYLQQQIQLRKTQRFSTGCTG